MAKVVVYGHEVISKENKTQYSNEKRAKELARRGYSVGNIKAMMYRKGVEIPAKFIEKAIKNDKVKLDGKLSY